MNHYRVSPAARSDLDGIWFYIAKDNPEAADRFIRLNGLRLRVNSTVNGAKNLKAL